ncbi:MAG: type IV toxin-antitoxin system AbiEi family antitoxin domain-containing protein [Microbacterium sp.]
MRSIPVFRYDDLRAAGHSSHAVTASIQAGRLVRLRPGVFVDSVVWEAGPPEGRVVARAGALDLISLTTPVFSHETAAALHGLPLYRPNPDRVHVIAGEGRPGAASGVVRHRGVLADDEVVEVDGLRCTSIERTVADVARTATFEQAITISDAALRTVCVPRPGEYSSDRASQFRAASLEIARRSAHGFTRAQRVLAFADGRAQLPGESISRIRLWELGFRRMELQVRVPGPAGSNYYVDFGLHDVRAFGEFDGTMKYVDGRLTDGRTTTEVFDREKQREDWIRGRTQYRYARWGWVHTATAKTLGDRLLAFGIRAPA